MLGEVGSSAFFYIDSSNFLFVGSDGMGSIGGGSFIYDGLWSHMCLTWRSSEIHLSDYRATLIHQKEEQYTAQGVYVASEQWVTYQGSNKITIGGSDVYYSKVKLDGQKQKIQISVFLFALGWSIPNLRLRILLWLPLSSSSSVCLLFRSDIRLWSHTLSYADVAMGYRDLIWPRTQLHWPFHDQARRTAWDASGQTTHTHTSTDTWTG